VPWLAEPQEALFDNRIKTLNEPPVKEYRDIKLRPTDPNYWYIESFDSLNDTSYKMFFVVLVILVLFYLFKNVK
jgi:hypothetical protein